MKNFKDRAKYFDSYSDSVKNFKDQFFLVVPLNQKAHSKIFNLVPNAPFLMYKYFSANIRLRVISLPESKCVVTRNNICVKKSYT